MDEAFGAVQAGGDLEGVIELTGRMNGPAGVHEFGLRVSRKNCSFFLLKLARGNCFWFCTSVSHEYLFLLSHGFCCFRICYIFVLVGCLY